MIVELLRNELFQEALNVIVTPEYPHTHLGRELIRNVCRRWQPTFWLEIGSLHGGSAIRVADETKRMELQTEIICIDPFCGYAELVDRNGNTRPWLGLKNGRQVLYEMFVDNIRKAGHEDVVLALPMTSVIGLPLIRAFVDAGKLPHPQVIYLDASHEYNETRYEIAASLDLLEPGGLLFGDDWETPDVQRALEGYQGALSPIVAPDQAVTQWMIRK